MSQSFICPMAFLATGVCSPGYVRLCCNSDESAFVRDNDGKIVEFLAQDSVHAHFNNLYMKKTRRLMMAGLVPKACERCHKVEMAGSKSPRLSYLDTYAEEIKQAVSETSHDGSLEPRIRYLDFALGNKCNLTCRMCLPEVAYKMAGDYDKISYEYNREQTELGKLTGERPVDDTFRKYFRSLLRDVREIQFTSGEPLLSAHQLEILKLAHELGSASQMSLIYYTNLTLLPKEILELWKSFKSVKIFVSLEGIREVNDYIRHPSRWSIIAANFDKLVQFSKNNQNIKCYVNTVFQAYNIHRIPELLEFLLPYAPYLPPIPSFNYIGHPEFLNPCVLPLEFRIEAKNRIESFLKKNAAKLEPYRYTINELSKHLDMLITGDLSHRLVHFVDYTIKLDKVRGQSLVEVMPEFAPLMAKADEILATQT